MVFTKSENDKKRQEWGIATNLSFAIRKSIDISWDEVGVVYCSQQGKGQKRAGTVLIACKNTISLRC